MMSFVDPSPLAYARPGAPPGRAAGHLWPALGLQERAAVVLAYVATLYSLALCFVNTHGLHVTTTSVIVFEMLIAAAAIPVLVTRLNLPVLLLALCINLNFFVLALLQQSTDLKPLRDWLMPVLFVWLGYLVDDRHVAERALRNLAIIATVLGLFEFVFPGTYNSLFDAIAFYKARGLGGSNPFALTVLQVRPTGIGRTILPFLGPRRMSSLFLEPVALGNFAVLTAAWALSKPREETREALILLALALAMIVMADARFGSITVLSLFVAQRAGLWRWTILKAALPFLAIASLLVIAWIKGSGYIGDNLVGRFQLSGNNLMNLSWAGWMGFPEVISLDAGYGYIIQRTGILICLLLWFAFIRMPLRDDQGRRFHFSAAVYISLNLCISGSSLFALKTSAILWFLLGSMVVHSKGILPAAPLAWSPMLRPRPAT